jgi:hypothetical protein
METTHDTENSVCEFRAVKRFVRAGLMIAALVTSALPVPTNAGEDAQSDPTGKPVGVSETEQTIRTGKVQFTATRDGRWVEFVPAWADGRSAILSGGFLLYATGADGRVTEVVNAARGGTRGAERAAGIEKCSEGTKGGLRAPSPDPDDDRDGRVDEDCLDGIDDDGDGRVDEDFAAIGDEMIAASYYASAVTAGGAVTELIFQQEAYAWALPHIDGMVMISLRVRNIGMKTLDAIRVGAFFEKQEPFDFSSQNVAPPKSVSTEKTSRVFVCEEAGAKGVGLVAFPLSGSEEAWTGGYLTDRDTWGDAIVEILNSNPAPAGRETNEDAAMDLDVTRVEDGAVVYTLSPIIGSLAPGEDIRVDLALVAAGDARQIAAVAAGAYETFIGDGVNRYLPPPVSMTPRVLWGTYRPAEIETPGTAGVLIAIEALGDDPVSSGEISYFSGLGAGSVVRREVQPGVVQLMIRGEAIEELARKGERITLKGRLEDGEFFEVILRPEERVASSVPGSDIEVELYWKKDGRLNQDLLNSSPNPFRDITTISYEVPSVIEKEDGSLVRSSEALDTSVKVYNVVGRLVSVLVEEVVGPGIHTTEWRAVDDHGNPVASGVYYVKLQLGQKYITKRLILLK